MIATDEIAEIDLPPSDAANAASDESLRELISDTAPDNPRVELSPDRDLPTQEWHLPRVRLSDYYV